MLESAVGLSVTATRQNEERSEYAAGAVFLPVAGGVNWPAPTTCACSIVAFFSVRVDRPSQDAAIAAIGLRTTTSAPTSTTARITSSQSKPSCSYCTTIICAAAHGCSLHVYVYVPGLSNVTTPA